MNLKFISHVSKQLFLNWTKHFSVKTTVRHPKTDEDRALYGVPVVIPFLDGIIRTPRLTLPKSASPNFASKIVENFTIPRSYNYNSKLFGPHHSEQIHLSNGGELDFVVLFSFKNAKVTLENVRLCYVGGTPEKPFFSIQSISSQFSGLYKKQVAGDDHTAVRIMLDDLVVSFRVPKPQIKGEEIGAVNINPEPGVFNSVLLKDARVKGRYDGQRIDGRFTMIQVSMKVDGTYRLIGSGKGSVTYLDDNGRPSQVIEGDFLGDILKPKAIHAHKAYLDDMFRMTNFVVVSDKETAYSSHTYSVSTNSVDSDEMSTDTLIYMSKGVAKNTVTKEDIDTVFGEFSKPVLDSGVQVSFLDRDVEFIHYDGPFKYVITHEQVVYLAAAQKHRCSSKLFPGSTTVTIYFKEDGDQYKFIKELNFNMESLTFDDDSLHCSYNIDALKADLDGFFDQYPPDTLNELPDDSPLLNDRKFLKTLNIIIFRGLYFKIMSKIGSKLDFGYFDKELELDVERLFETVQRRRASVLQAARQVRTYNQDEWLPAWVKSFKSIEKRVKAVPTGKTPEELALKKEAWEARQLRIREAAQLVSATLDDVSTSKDELQLTFNDIHESYNTNARINLNELLDELHQLVAQLNELRQTLKQTPKSADPVLNQRKNDLQKELKDFNEEIIRLIKNLNRRMNVFSTSIKEVERLFFSPSLFKRSHTMDRDNLLDRILDPTLKAVLNELYRSTSRSKRGASSQKGDGGTAYAVYWECKNLEKKKGLRYLSPETHFYKAEKYMGILLRVMAQNKILPLDHYVASQLYKDLKLAVDYALSVGFEPGPPQAAATAVAAVS